MVGFNRTNSRTVDMSSILGIHSWDVTGLMKANADNSGR